MQMKNWSKRMGFEINKSLYFTKATMEDSVNLCMSCGEAVTTLKMAERGDSMLVCMLQLMAAMAESRLKDAAAEKTEATRTLEEELLYLLRIRARHHMKWRALRSVWQPT